MEKEAVDRKKAIFKTLEEKGISVKLDKDSQKEKDEQEMKKILDNIMKKYASKKKPVIEKPVVIEPENIEPERNRGTIKHDSLRETFGKKFMINKLRAIYEL